MITKFDQEYYLVRHYSDVTPISRYNNSGSIKQLSTKSFNDNYTADRTQYTQRQSLAVIIIPKTPTVTPVRHLYHNITHL